MTNEDLDQIRALLREEIRGEIAASEQRMAPLLREEIAASEQRMAALLRGEIAASEQRMAALLREEIREEIAASEQRMTARQDRAVEMIAGEISSLREDMNHRFEAVDRRFEVLDRRTERISESMAAMTRWADKLDRDSLSLTGTQAAQQRAIDDLAARVNRIERELRPGQQQ
ncbi:MAG TPA: hypothetical protein VE959_00590 [Bryobacteraceae bacterium]|nr:hypothetical protein [Bryobacteraceae bacterium]